ncbi:hypothetical protein AX16_001826 [Volvariella volvacea WC 439]|nr:hypothetical protein AX16_001826 [Volvariella volvacea WC 439]
MEKIPVVKTPIIPLKAMDIPNSKVAENLSTLEALADQTGISDLNDIKSILNASDQKKSIEDISKYITLVFGDLGTGDHIATAHQHQAAEKTSWRWLQNFLFIIEPKKAHAEANSIMNDVAILYLQNTGVISSKLTYHQMQTVIQNSEIIQYLDAWRAEVTYCYPQFTTHRAYAKSHPSLHKLQDIINHLAKKLVADHHI